MQIDGQIALVTGGGSGLGEATARLLASRGARVAVLDFDADKANAVAADIGGFGVQADVGNADAWRLVHVKHHLAPRRDDKAVAIGGAAIGVFTRLRGGDHPAAGFDGAGAQQHMPMGLAGGPGARGAHPASGSALLLDDLLLVGVHGLVGRPVLVLVAGDEAARRVPDAMVTGFQALGTRAMVQDRLRRYRDAGINTLKLGLDGVPQGPQRYELLENIVELTKEL